MKPVIFIGSSANHLETLDKVANILSDVGQCRPWTFAFSKNKSNLDSLIRQTKLSDFCIMIAMKDDLLLKKEEVHEVPRDNVIFEFGLFLGSAGLNKAYLLAEEGMNLPTDLDGITVSTFTKEEGKYNSLDKVCDEIKILINKQSKVSELGLLPSTALAIGYYYNFVYKVCEELHSSNKIIIDHSERILKDFTFNVIIPKGIDDKGIDSFKALYYKQHNLNNASTATVEPTKRGYPFVFKLDPPEQHPNSQIAVQLYDVPDALNTILEALKLYMPSEHVGKNDESEFLEKRELDNFSKVLKYLISRNTATKNHVIVYENVDF